MFVWIIGRIITIGLVIYIEVVFNPIMAFFNKEKP